MVVSVISHKPRKIAIILVNNVNIHILTLKSTHNVLVDDKNVRFRAVCLIHLYSKIYKYIHICINFMNIQTDRQRDR